MLTARERLNRRKGRPALVQVHRALSRLTSTLTVMNTGAHPDDEQSGMLAAMRFGFGMRVIVACSTRGEGGQNSLGPERTGALGIVRTREMEEAARTLDADIVWLGHGPDDPVHDFGFSKNGPDTLARWGRERIIERLVRAYRRERPDIVIPTFLDVPGQHGHHRAMTEAAEIAISMAADPLAFPEHMAEGLKPWRVSKYYLPAWSGGGDTYDDEVPPPNATVSVRSPGRDAATGASYGEIGEWSRAYHASQGMGFWRAEPKAEWPLHLKLGGRGPEDDIRAYLLATLVDLVEGASDAAGKALIAAQQQINAALEAFPDRGRIIAALVEAAGQIEMARAALTPEQMDQVGHRLERKLSEIDAALIEAAGIVGTAWVEPNTLSPGGTGMLCVHLETVDSQRPVEIKPVLPVTISAGAASVEKAVARYPLTVSAEAPIANAYPAGYSSLLGNGAVRVGIEADVGGRRARAVIDLEEDVQIVPAQSVTLSPDAVIVSTRAVPDVVAVAANIEGTPVKLELATVPGITAVRSQDGFEVRLAKDLAAGRYTLPVLADGAQAYRQTPIAYPHIGRSRFIAPQALDALALDLVLPEGKVGYVGGGSDRVGVWLKRMGADVTELDAAALRGDLSGYSTIVVGIFAFGLRPDLLATSERLRGWVEAGGHLVTLYHRPADGWNPDSTPPRRLVIGSPSLRWRVTNPNAEVDILLPQHPLLTRPNAITSTDFDGWDKERGLYFASQWDEAYQPLLAMHDEGEQPLTGSLLSAQIGKGRHTHTSLVLHHQLDRLVPGAFRLLANLIQPA